jgi:DNA-binding NtrC family response regulator
MNHSILIVDDDISVQKALGMTLEGSYRILTAGTGSASLEICDQQNPDMVLLDIGLPDISGIYVIRQIKTKQPEIIVIMITAVEDVKTVVEALKQGAYDYLVKPIDAQELLLTIQNAFENRRLKDQIQALQKPQIDRVKFDFIGQSPNMRAVLEIARKVSASRDTSVLIVGESGAGKGVLARLIHYNSRENPGPFVTVNCGAIAKDLIESELFGYERGAYTGAKTEGKKGLFEASADGSLFLDDIGAMPFSAQAKLLGVLEDRKFYKVGGTQRIEISSRVIAATNIDLERAVNEGQFRKDLYFRLNVVKIEVPSLRERPDDIIPLTEYFMVHYNRKFDKRFSRISAETKKLLLGYHWPGNVRELRNSLERIILLENNDTLRPEYFLFNTAVQQLSSQGLAFKLAADGLDYEAAVRTLIGKALEKTGGNVLEASRLLKMPLHKLRYRIKKYGLKN